MKTVRLRRIKRYTKKNRSILCSRKLTVKNGHEIKMAIENQRKRHERKLRNATQCRKLIQEIGNGVDLMLQEMGCWVQLSYDAWKAITRIQERKGNS